MFDGGRGGFLLSGTGMTRMSQSTLDDDDLFGEAADELRADVEAHLDAARRELPGADEVWDTDADNVLGVLNGLDAALDVGDAHEELRQAKKWFAVGQRADAFEDDDGLEADLAAVGEALELVAGAEERVSKLTSTVPELRGTLQELDADGEDGAGAENETDEPTAEADEEEAAEVEAD